MADFLALGCGLVGQFVVKKLSQLGHRLHVIDLHIGDDIKALQDVSFEEGDVFSLITEKQHRIAINMLPGRVGQDIRERLLNLDYDIIDIAFTDTNPEIHDELARDKKLRLIWDVGIAPGLSNMIVKLASLQNNELNKIAIKVGGNPRNPDGNWSYMAPFSPSDVIEEYTRPARIVSKGKIETVPALSERHQIDATGYGKMEAFLTDGVRSLLTSIQCDEIKEYTVRWPGHIDKWLMEKDKISEQELLEMWKFDSNQAEFTWMSISIEGDNETQNWIVSDDGKEDASSMARTTGLVTVACALELLQPTSSLQMNVDYGVIPPEGLDEQTITQVIEFLKSEGVKISVSLKE